MEIKVTSQYLNKEQMVLVEEFALFCAKKYRLQRHPNRIWVSVCKNLEGNTEGDCDFLEYYGFNEVKVRARYHKNMKTILTIIGHEMVHAKQFITGQLKYDGAKAYWRGDDVSSIEYQNQPHEAEAFMMEDKLLAQFYESRKKKRQRKPNQKSPI